MRPSLRFRRFKDRLECSVGGGPLAAYGAAYALTDEAYAAVERRGRAWLIRLWPKTRGPARLAGRFRAEYENQLLRWELARQGRPLRAEILRRALLLADQAGAEAFGLEPGAVDVLAAEQRLRIESLLREAETAPRDPLGIATPWETLRRGAP